MPLDLNKFIQRRPYLYHLTARRNISYIAKDMLLKPATNLLAEAGQSVLNRTVRRQHYVINIGERKVAIRDQKPFYSGKMRLPDDWTFEDFVQHLNLHVFFWPGSESQPIKSGINHFRRYVGETPTPVILRVSTRDILESNKGIEPLFCQYNSGAPRCSYGKKIPRGPQTFLPANVFCQGVGKVVEIVFQSPVQLPRSVEAADSADGVWRKLNNWQVFNQAPAVKNRASI